jgi:hypothetical protein
MPFFILSEAWTAFIICRCRGLARQALTNENTPLPIWRRGVLLCASQDILKGVENKYIPDNLPECFRLVEQEVSAEALDRLRRYQKNELGKEHSMGWGLFLRNRFIHSKDSAIRDKIARLPGVFPHHDTYGAILLKALWAHLNSLNGPETLLQSEIEERQWVLDLMTEMGMPEAWDNFQNDWEQFLKEWEQETPKLEDVLPLYQSGDISAAKTPDKLL